MSRNWVSFSLWCPELSSWPLVSPHIIPGLKAIPLAPKRQGQSAALQLKVNRGFVTTAASSHFMIPSWALRTCLPDGPPGPGRIYSLPSDVNSADAFMSRGDWAALLQDGVRQTDQVHYHLQTHHSQAGVCLWVSTQVAERIWNLLTEELIEEQSALQPNLVWMSIQRKTSCKHSDVKSIKLQAVCSVFKADVTNRLSTAFIEKK